MGTYSKLLQDEQKNIAVKSQSTAQSPNHEEEKKSKRSERRSVETSIRRSVDMSKRPSVDPSKRRNDTTQTKPVIRMAFDLPGDMTKAIRKEKAMREIQEGRAVSLSEIAREAFSQYLREASNRRSD